MQQAPVAGGEWKGLATAMRVDNAGQGDPSGFQISERLTSSRETTTPQMKASTGVAEGSGPQGRGSEQNKEEQARIGEQSRMPALPQSTDDRSEVSE